MNPNSDTSLVARQFRLQQWAEQIHQCQNRPLTTTASDFTLTYRLQGTHSLPFTINPKLCIEGILITMVDARTNYAKDISNLIRNTYCNKITVFNTEIPRSVRAAETSAEGKSIFAYDPSGKVAEAYESLTQEVLKYDQKRN